MYQEFDLTVQINASVWAYTQRRATYLEAMLIRVLRDEEQLQEWFSAEALASLKLPGLMVTAATITRKANAGRWRRKWEAGTKRHRYVYHVTCLPARAFDALISRLLNMPDIEEDHLDDTEPVAEPASTAITAPPWVLPLMRLIKSGSDLTTAWQELPDNLPEGVNLPSVEEAATVLVRFGLAT